MKTKKNIAMGLFFLLGLSTLVFGAFIFYVTFDLDSMDGRTILTGEVKDTDDEPLEGVHVICQDRETFSDENGQWTLNGVPEGLVNVDLFDPGYVRLSIKWLAYPFEEVKDDLGKSANNLSYSFEQSGDEGIILKREMVEYDLDHYSIGNLTINVGASISDLGTFTEILFSNGTKELRSQPISAGITTMIVSGIGSFKLGFDEQGPFLTGFHPVPGEIDVTTALKDMIIHDQDREWSGRNGILNVTMVTEDEIHDLNIMIKDFFTGMSVSQRVLGSPIDSVFILAPGVYTIEVTSRSYVDSLWSAVVMGEGSTEEMEIQLFMADTETRLDDLSVKGNFTIAVSYMAISLVLFFGGYYTKKDGSWAVLLILAFVGFLSRGLIDLFIFNINSLIAIVLVVILFTMRGEYNKMRMKKSVTGNRKL
ncbi:MAG: carboxypeptidase regulatory-like domain-containing protein [Candidatus Thermoplasmatota archaeon]|nr:carboxypeptidase regulatory-like domain-containing protein [Candidatus Thermoplasmatota archaeon]